MSETNNFYVYVYIDPRNFEEFYYGKGQGGRIEHHDKEANNVTETETSEKIKRIKDIKKAGLEPIKRVVVRELTEPDAYLVEETLLWKLGKTLTNVSAGHFADKFRSRDTLFFDQPGFDFQNKVFFTNVGEGPHRCWEDSRKYGFISAGQGKKYSDQMKRLKVGDIIVAYLKTKGYVGVGVVEAKACGVDDFKYDNKSLRDVSLGIKNIFENSDNEKSEYLVKVKWIKSVDKEHANWKKKSGLFTSQDITASLENQPITIQFIENSFGIKLLDIEKTISLL